MTAIIAVVGATGNQGGAVARSLLQNKAFKVRALTRNPESQASIKLATAGADVIKADAFDKQEMISAFQGAWGAFVNFNSEDQIFKKNDGVTEFSLGENVIDAAITANVQHLIFSSAPSYDEITGIADNVENMQMKHKIQQYAQQLNEFKTVTFIIAGWYLENFLSRPTAKPFGGFPYFPDSDGYLTFRVPEWAVGEGDKRVPCQLRTFDELVLDFQKVTQKQSRYQPIRPSWREFNADDFSEFSDIKLLFAYTQITGGQYFGEATDIGTAVKLKQAAASVLGKQQEEQHLITVKQYFSKYFSHN